MALKINQKLKPKMDRFLASIFDGFRLFLGGKLGGKIEPRRSKMASKKRWKNGRQQDGQKIEIGHPKASRHQGSRALGKG